VFNLLPRKKNGLLPLIRFEEVEVCSLSGYLAQEKCKIITGFLKGGSTAICPYHKTFILDKSGQFRGIAVVKL
jgi:penicillin-binding protein 1C